MTETILLLPILVPTVGAALVLAMRRSFGGAREPLAILTALANLAVAIVLFNKDLAYTVSWGGFGFEFALRVYQFSGFIMLAVASFGLLVAIYSWKFMRDRPYANQFYCYLLLSLAMVNGAVLADHLIALLFFWEGLLLTLFAMIAIGGRGAFRTATKAFIIVGVSDLCLLLGIVITGWQAGTLTISQIHLPVAGMGAVAMILLMIGAVAKGGSMPFHTWIPDAAVDAPLPFMAFMPASIEKLLGIYLLARISLDMFRLEAHSWMSVLMMVVGAAGLLLAVMMALVQKDYKKLLAYHAISQLGYMILGIGTAIPAGIVGGLFHMLNNAVFKSCLFLTAGSVEKRAGTTDLAKLGGLGRLMPVTFGCFLIAAMAISGVPPFNGFFSKELIYDAAMERHVIFYAVALIGSFFTAASFLKLGHAAFLGKRDPRNDNVREAPLSMLAPMIILAAICVLFGVYNALPLNYLIQPVLGAQRLEGHSFAGFPASALLVVLTLVTLGAALLNHVLGARAAGRGLGAVDHIHHAPVLSAIYDKAEKRYFDPYDVGLAIVRPVSRILWRADRAIDWLYDTLSVSVSYSLGAVIRFAHNGDYSRYVVWSLAGAAAVIVFLMMS